MRTLKAPKKSVERLNQENRRLRSILDNVLLDLDQASERCAAIKAGQAPADVDWAGRIAAGIRDGLGKMDCNRRQRHGRRQDALVRFLSE